MMLSISLDCATNVNVYILWLRSQCVVFFCLLHRLIRSFTFFSIWSLVFVSYLSFGCSCLYFPFVQFDSGGAHLFVLSWNQTNRTAYEWRPGGQLMYSVHTHTRVSERNQQATNEMTWKWESLWAIEMYKAQFKCTWNEFSVKLELVGSLKSLLNSEISSQESENERKRPSKMHYSSWTFSFENYNTFHSVNLMRWFPIFCDHYTGN